MTSRFLARCALPSLFLAGFAFFPAMAQDAGDEEAAGTIAVEDTAPAAEVPAPKEATQLDAIQVTGSRLKRTDYETSQPVLTLTREDIDRTGLTDITEILRNVTAAGNNSLSPQQGRFALTLGEANIDLRNLGANHTLLLVNGRRWVTGLNQTNTGTSDYNTIPSAIIERVEVLKDGASAIYGSDAIGGVVNVITRKDFSGRNLSYHFGQYFQQGDGVNQQASLSWGENFGGTNVFFNVNYTDQDEIPNENREISAVPNAGPTRNSIVSQNGAFLFVDLDNSRFPGWECPNLQAGIAAGAAGESTTGGPVGMTSIIPAGLVLCSLTLNQGADGTLPSDYHQIDNTNPLDTFNRFGDGTLKEPNERLAFFTQVEHPLTDRIALSFEGLYNQRKSLGIGQNSYLGGGNLDGGQRGHLAHVAASNPINAPGHDIGYDSSCGGTGTAPLPVDQYENSASCTGIGDGTGVWAIRRGLGLNNQTFRHQVDTIRAGGSAAGDFDLFDNTLFWEGGYVYATSKIEQLLTSVNYEKAGKAIGSFGAVCDGDCVPFNPFQGQAGLDPAAVAYILDTASLRNRNRQTISYANVTGEFPVPGDFLAGPVATAVGIEYRTDYYSSSVDPIIQQGLIRLNTASNLEGDTNAKEAYVEFGIPLLKDIPGFKALELDLAGRYSQYPRIDAVTTGKAGLRWQVIEDLLLRGTYSTGFRAPNVGELYLAPSQSFDPLSDPCANPGENDTADSNCAQDGASGGGGGGVAQPYDIWQGNLDLEPERSVNLTYGLIYSPNWLPDFNVNVDFYDITIDDFVVIGQGQFFLDSCYKTERPTGAPPNSGPNCEYIERDPSGALVSIVTPFFNLSKVETRGVDIGMDYILPLPPAMGQVKVELDTTYLQQYDFSTPVIGGPDDVFDAVGTAGGQFQGYPRWKANSVVGWQRDRMKASWATRMAYRMIEDCGDLFPSPSLKDMGLCSHPDVEDADGNSTPKHHLRTLFYHNIQFGYEFTEHQADVVVGINNVLDQDPNVSRSLTSLYWYNYDPNHYEVPGRLGYVRLRFSF